MLRLSYIKFMQDLQLELKDKVGLPFQVGIDIKIGIPTHELNGANEPVNPEQGEKLKKYMTETLGPLIKSMPDKVIME